MLYPPITLPLSKYLATTTTLLNEIRFSQNLSETEVMNSLIDSSRIGKVNFGKGIIYDYFKKVQDKNDLSETSHAFTIKKPSIAQEVAVIDKYVYFEVSHAMALAGDAVTNGEAFSAFENYIMGILQISASVYLFNEINEAIQSYRPTQVTQTIEVDYIDTTGLTGADLESANRINATSLAKAIQKECNNMQLYSNKYTDEVDTYTAVRPDNLKMLFNDKFKIDLQADAMASLYHNDKVGNMVVPNEIITIPTDAVSPENTDIICIICDKKQFGMADFYKLTFSIVDPSTLYTNVFLHLAYGVATFKHAPTIIFKKKLLVPAKG